MTARTKIDVHVGTLSMEFGDTLVKFKIFEALKHPTEDHSLFGINFIDELVEECLQLGNKSKDISDFIGDTDSFDCLGSIIEEANYDELWEVHNLSDSEDDNTDLADLNQECKHEKPECSNKAEVKVAKTKKLFPTQVATISNFSARQSAKSDSNPTRADSILAKRSRPQQPKAEIMLAHLGSSPIQVSQPDLKASNDNSSSPPPPIKLKPLPSHLKYAYLDTKQQLSVFIANNL
ncbi:hypothetical protein CR513_35976, partial [Mucuna pruriens]